MDTTVLSPPRAMLAEARTAVVKALEMFQTQLHRNTDGEATDLVKDTVELVAMAEGLSLLAIGDFDKRGIAKDIGAKTTTAWLTATCRQTPATARANVKVATAITGSMPEVGELLASGTGNLEQARAIVDSVRKIAKHADAEQTDFARDLMTEHATRHHAGDLRQLGRVILNHADTDGPRPREDETVQRMRGVTYKDHHDGTHSITYRDSIENLAKVKAAIGSLEAPRDAADLRSTSTRRADAMVILFEKFLRPGDLPNSRGVAPHITLVTGLDTLKGLTGAAYAALATGSALTPQAVQKLYCDAEITPIVLDPKGRPLSIGRTSRTWPAHIWKALVARDTGCVGLNCTAPPWLCRAHHLQFWEEHHGETSVDNGALVCPQHHDDVHHRDWTLRLGEDGIPEWIAPVWVDPSQTPQRNVYWQLQRELLKPPDLPGND